jgi:serine/threonine-protein kinase
MLGLQTETVAMMTENALANPRLMAALRGRVNRDTLADVVETESWWEPYRDLRAAISYDGATFAFAQTDGEDGVSVTETAGRVAETGRPASAVMAGRDGAFLVAARPARFGPDRVAVLVLARRIDGPLLERLAGAVHGAVLISDGTRALGQGGADAALLVPLAGREANRHVILPASTAHAATVEIAPGLWLWALGRATDAGPAGAVADRSRRKMSWAIAIAVALVIGAVSLRPGRRRPRAAPPALLPPPPVTIEAGATGAGIASSPPVAMMVRPGPGTALGRYLLVDQIGAGGMAEVFTAVTFGVGRFRRPFVIKRLRAELDNNPTALGLFIDEANLASTLVHPNVVPVFDFGEAGGSYFLAEEYIVGRDLGRIISRLYERGEPMLSHNAILHLANEVLAGLAYAHDKRDEAGRPVGLVHRDITPANVIISERGEVKILDFGIMKATQRVSQTDSGTVRGNVCFMSPEQARGHGVDQRSDLYSIGLVILYAATGEQTYPGNTFYDLLNAAAAGPGDAIRARLASLPAPLPAILTRALEVDPDKRFQSSAEFSAAITPHLIGGGSTELAVRLISLFGDELRAEQERLTAASSHVPRPQPLAGAGA